MSRTGVKKVKLNAFKCVDFVSFGSLKNSSDTDAFKQQSRKIVKQTQTIRQQIADKLFECVWPFCETGA